MAQQIKLDNQKLERLLNAVESIATSMAPLKIAGVLDLADRFVGSKSSNQPTINRTSSNQNKSGDDQLGLFNIHRWKRIISDDLRSEQNQSFLGKYVKKRFGVIKSDDGVSSHQTKSDSETLSATNDSDGKKGSPNVDFSIPQPLQTRSSLEDATITTFKQLFEDYTRSGVSDEQQAELERYRQHHLTTLGAVLDNVSRLNETTVKLLDHLIEKAKRDEQLITNQSRTSSNGYDAFDLIDFVRGRGKNRGKNVGKKSSSKLSTIQKASSIGKNKNSVKTLSTKTTTSPQSTSILSRGKEKLLTPKTSTDVVDNVKGMSKFGKIAKFGGIGALVGAGFAVGDYLDKAKQIENDTSVSAENKVILKDNARNELVGAAAGSIGGSAGGAALGAAIGTAILPGIGTAIGGFLGGIAGGTVGEGVGSVIGKLFNSELKQEQPKQNPQMYADVRHNVRYKNGIWTVTGEGLTEEQRAKMERQYSTGERVITYYDRRNKANKVRMHYRPDMRLDEYNQRVKDEQQKIIADTGVDEQQALIQAKQRVYFNEDTAYQTRKNEERKLAEMREIAAADTQEKINALNAKRKKEVDDLNRGFTPDPELGLSKIDYKPDLTLEDAKLARRELYLREVQEGKKINDKATKQSIEDRKRRDNSTNQSINVQGGTNIVNNSITPGSFTGYNKDRLTQYYRNASQYGIGD